MEPKPEIGFKPVVEVLDGLLSLVDAFCLSRNGLGHAWARRAKKPPAPGCQR